MAAPRAGPFTVASVAAAVGGRVEGDSELTLSGVAALPAACASDLSFLTHPAYAQAAASSRAGCVIVASDRELPGRTRIVAEDPHRAYALAMRLFHPETRPEAGVAQSACVDPSARLGPGVHVGHRAVVGQRCVVGAGSAILAGAVVGDDCEVGAGCTLHPGVVLYPGTVLGERVIVHANAVLGSDGFGYASGADGHLKIPHVGHVVIEDDVEIGAGTCVDRAVLGQTRIGAGTKIDNLVQVGHNVALGERSLLVAQSGIAGSTTLGRGCVLAGQSGVAGHLVLGEGARVAAKSAALSSVEAGQTVAGIPAMPHARWKRVVAALGRLPELLRRMSRVESKLGLEPERDEHGQDAD